jgi:hypothetical protein
MANLRLPTALTVLVIIFGAGTAQAQDQGQSRAPVPTDEQIRSAILKGDVARIQSFLAAGMSPDRVVGGEPVVHLAAAILSYDVLKTLVDHQASVLKVLPSGETIQKFTERYVRDFYADDPAKWRDQANVLSLLNQRADTEKQEQLEKVATEKQVQTENLAAKCSPELMQLAATYWTAKNGLRTVILTRLRKAGCEQLIQIDGAELQRYPAGTQPWGGGKDATYSTGAAS